MGGYFILGGKKIFTDFYFNHQPGMAFISALIQKVTTPQSIPELILRHRQFIFIFSFISTTLLTFKFGPRILLVSFIYEVSKFYVFGDRFLAESITGFLTIYLVVVVLEQFLGKFKKYDILAVPIVVWAIVFLREPLIPVALFLFAVYVANLYRKNLKQALISSGILFICCAVTITQFEFNDYFLNLVTANQKIFTSETTSSPIYISILVTVFYPIYILIAPGQWGMIRILEGTLSIVFIINILFYAFTRRRWNTVFLSVLSLTLINLRPVIPGREFYEAFHIAPWYLLFIFWSIFFTYENYAKLKKITALSGLVLVTVILYILFHKNYFPKEKIQTHDEFFTNFSYVMDSGTTIRNLSDPTDTLFVDGYDDLVIWEAKLKPSYKFTWYTSFMPHMENYRNERERMFQWKRPDFYYGECMPIISKKNDSVSKILKNEYVQINPLTDKSCILVSYEKVRNISSEKKEKLLNTKYKLP